MGKYDKKEKRDSNSDRFILSKGHAAPILYAAWALVDDAEAAGGSLPLRQTGPAQAELVNHLRETGHVLEGHPTPKIPFVDVATGSLGQGINCAAGMAYVGKYLDKASYKTFCLLGDGETAEGSVYEAMAFAGHYKLNNLVAIVDMNNALKAADASEKPTVLVCKTFKGRGFEGVEDKLNWHGKPLSDPQKFVEALLNQLPEDSVTLPKTPAVVKDAPYVSLADVEFAKLPIPDGTTKMSTRKAYGITLASLK